MTRKMLVAVVLFAICLQTGALAQTLRWEVGNVNGDWFDAGCWRQGAVPTFLNGVQMYGSNSQASGAFINGGDAEALEIRNGGDSGAPSSYITMNAGTLTTANWIMMGTDSSGIRSGVFVMNGGEVTVGTGTRSSGHLYVGSGFSNMPTGTGLSGALVMTGGIIDVGGTFSIGRRHTSGFVNLDGGVIYAGNFRMKDDADGVGGILDGRVQMDITGGVLIIDGDRTAAIAEYISYGWITGYGSEDDVFFDYDITNSGKTTVWAIPEPATVSLLGLGLLGLVRRKK